MTETLRSRQTADLRRIEPDERLVVLARTLEAPAPDVETALAESASKRARFGETCLGQALYRHRSVFRDAAEAPPWSHLELTYFRNLLPAGAASELVLAPPAAGALLLRAEILLTSPGSFILPRDWCGAAARPEWQASLEYIQVETAALEAYRDVMRDYCGPAAARLVREGRFGTFRAMETAAVLYQDPDLKIEWNQIHLCELDPSSFSGFGREFAAALRNEAPDSSDFENGFAGLDRMRSVPRWTFNDPVLEADSEICRPSRRFSAAGA